MTITERAPRGADASLSASRALLRPHEHSTLLKHGRTAALPMLAQCDGSLVNIEACQLLNISSEQPFGCFVPREASSMLGHTFQCKPCDLASPRLRNHHKKLHLCHLMFL